MELKQNYLLELYFNIRFMEEESEFSNYEKNTIIRDAIGLCLIDGVSSGITVFEKLINKTFDYSGSLSYIEKRQQDLRK